MRYEANKDKFTYIPDPALSNKYLKIIIIIFRIKDIK